jgi:hypothetical protein
MPSTLYSATITKRNMKKFMESRKVQNYFIYCNLDKDKMCYIMNTILVKYCKVDICGYNKENDEYWAKIIKNNVCNLYFNISVTNSGVNKSKLEIKVNEGGIKNIEYLIENFIDNIRLYEE